jgi:glucan-binding YG repeat protein
MRLSLRGSIGSKPDSMHERLNYQSNTHNAIDRQLIAHEALNGFNIVPIQSGAKMTGKSTREGLRNKNRFYRLNRQHEAIAKIYGLHQEKGRSRNNETTSTNQNLSSENSISQRDNSLNRDNRFSISHI